MRFWGWMCARPTDRHGVRESEKQKKQREREIECVVFSLLVYGVLFLVVRFWSALFDLFILCAMFHYFRPHIALSTYLIHLYFVCINIECVSHEFWESDDRLFGNDSYQEALTLASALTNTHTQHTHYAQRWHILFAALHNLFTVFSDWKLNLDKLLRSRNRIQSVLWNKLSSMLAVVGSNGRLGECVFLRHSLDCSSFFPVCVIQMKNIGCVTFSIN